MASIVGAFTSSHVLLDRTGCEERADRVFRGMKEILRRINALAPDVVVIVGNDHFVNLDLAREIPFAIPIQDQFVPAGDMGLPPEVFLGAPDFACGAIDHLREASFDITALREYRPCHGVALPAFMSAPNRSRRIVPVVTNTLMDPPPSPQRCYELGRHLAAFIERKRPPTERVVLLGTGGLSHWVAVAGQGELNFDFDQRVFDLFHEGRAEELSRLTAAEILQSAGNGALELINWLVVAGALHGKRGEKIYYERMPEWFTGMAGLQIAV